MHMQMILDSREITIDAVTIGDAIEFGAREAERSGRCIAEVYVDGSPFTHEQIASDAACLLPAREVRLVTALAADLIDEALHNAAAAVDHIAEVQREAAEFIECDQMVDAMSMMREAVDAWLAVQETAMTAAAYAGLDLETFVTEEIDGAVVIARLRDHLSQITQSLRNRDTIMLSDILLYEFPQTISDWKRLLIVMSERLRNLDTCGSAS